MELLDGAVDHRLHLGLDGPVDRQPDVAAGAGRAQRDRVQRDATGPAHLEPLARAPGQLTVVLALDAGPVGAAVGEVGVAEQLRRLAVGRVVAADAVGQKQPGWLGRHDPGRGGNVELRNHPRLDDAAVRRQPWHQQVDLAKQRPAVLGRVAQSLGDEVGRLDGILHLRRMHHQILGGDVLGERLPGAVEDATA